jgi:hypothetical protein
MIAFILYRRDNRIYLICAGFLIIAGWTFFKLFFPYPTLIYDSYFYIKAAVLKQDINAWPIGYSKFLQLFGFFSHSALLLVTIQYLLLSISCLFFFFTWSLLFKPAKWVKNLVFLWLFANPLSLYCCNYIMADCLFVAISLVWFTQLLWIIYRPKDYYVLIHAVLLLLAFTIRYNALYYPLISSLAFLLSRQSRWIKMAGIILPLILIGSFVVYTRNQVAIVSGKEQFSPFGGWKLANDALYMYAHVIQEDPGPVPVEFRNLDQVVRAYFAQTHDPGDILKPDQTSGSPFMFFYDTPLIQYMFAVYGPGGPTFNCPKWMAIAPLYQRYGSYLLQKYPVSFCRYFMVPNLWRYALPPSENYGTDVSFYLSDALAGSYVKDLLGLTTITTKRSHVKWSTVVLKQYPIVFFLSHLLFILAGICFCVRRHYKMLDSTELRCLYLIFLLWLVDLAFSVFSAGIVLRYQLFMVILELSFGLYFVDRIIEGNRIKNKQV